MSTRNDQPRFLAACERFGIPCRRDGERLFIMDEDVEREVVVCPATEQEADAVHPCDVVIEDELIVIGPATRAGIGAIHTHPAPPASLVIGSSATVQATTSTTNWRNWARGRAQRRAKVGFRNPARAHLRAR